MLKKTDNLKKASKKLFKLNWHFKLFKIIKGVKNIIYIYIYIYIYKMPKKIKMFLVFILILIIIAVFVITRVLQIINCNYLINTYNEYYETLKQFNAKDLNSIFHKNFTYLKNIASFLKYFIIIIVIINFLFVVLYFYIFYKKITYKSSIKTEKNKSLIPIYIEILLVVILLICNVLIWVATSNIKLDISL